MTLMKVVSLRFPGTVHNCVVALFVIGQFWFYQSGPMRLKPVLCYMTR